MKNFIGLEKKKAKDLTEKLNALLANYQLFYQNLRGFHWNIKGESFFELHIKFEEYYTQANISIDEIAERILTLEGQPLHSFTDYLNHTRVKEVKNVSDGRIAVNHIREGYQTLLEIERQILEIAQAANDEGTSSMMSDYIVATEKTLWMLNAYLGGKV